MPDTADPPGAAAPHAGDAAPDAAPRRPAVVAGRVVAALALGLAAVLTAHYPLAPALLAAALVVYGAVLWRWPVAWLVVVPAALPAFDLAPWTGWLYVEESDLVVLVTLAVLALRAPPERTDFLPRGVGGVAVALAALAAAVAVARGLMLAGLPGGSDIAYLRPDNALRVAKGFVVALVLMPFLRRTLRTRDDGARWLAAGMAAGLALVAAAALAERAAFTGAFDFHSPYRIVATFSSMHLGGGYVGLYVAMALPFLFVPWPRRGVLARAAAAATALAALYTLVVTFARAAYGSAVVASIVLMLGVHRAGRGGRWSLAALAVPAGLAVVIAGVVAAAVDSPFMSWRLDQVMPDLAARVREWTTGLALDGDGIATTLVGRGLGTYARSVYAAAPAGVVPGNFVLRAEDGRRFLSLGGGLRLYVGQKVAVAPNRLYRIALDLRSPDGKGVLSVVLCEKMLLYSAQCRGVDFRPDRKGSWQHFDAVIPSAGIGDRVVLHVLRRPVELSFFLPVFGTRMDVGAVRLDDPDGRELVANGDFSRGLARWFYTDDAHWIWRIENQYLTTWFEGGALGVVALVLLWAAAFSGALRAIRAGDAVAPAVAAALAAFLVSGLFDCPLEVPRLAALFYLLAFAGLALGEEAL